VAFASADFGARGVSTALTAWTFAAGTCATLSLPASDRLRDCPACAPADIKTIEATRMILRM
jgi:hypothetical protein